MDATAVAAARGLAASRIRLRDVLWVAGLFGGFQALMPLLGYALGALLGPFVTSVAPYVAFVLLAGIGGKMVWEALHHEADALPAPAPEPLFALGPLVLLAIATSIDAFAAGFTLPLLGAPMGVSVAVIGVVTALLSAAGLFAGRSFGAILGSRLDLAGGAALILLAVKVLVEGAFFKQ
jgi:putative Mn2+ efflux pump MntP